MNITKLDIIRIITAFAIASLFGHIYRDVNLFRRLIIEILAATVVLFTMEDR